MVTTQTRNANKEKKTIVLVGAVPPPHHGQTVFTKALLASRVRDEFIVYHLDTSDRRSLANIGALDAWNVILALHSIAMIALQCFRRPDIVYIPISQNTLGFLRDGLLILAASACSNTKIIIHFHGGESFNDFRHVSNSMMQRFIRFVLSRVDVAIVLGDRLRKLFSPEVPQIKVVPNGIDFPVHQQRVSAAKKVICVSYLGGLFRAKGILDLIEAASIVLKKHRSVCFEFAGEWWDQEPDTKQNVMEILKTGAITSQVDFKGKLTGSAKEEFLLNADMIVLPSWNEGLPIVILEAMAASAPVISTKVGAIPEVVVDNVTGILVDKQDPPQLADAIIRLIEYPDLRRAMGEAGRKRYLEFFTFEKCANRMIDVFHAAISHDESFQNGIAKQAVSSERPLAERSVA